eukprot:m.1113830 g.1113830  ORF g.1113830 m.1113830 type:complete len:436 (-) comp24363_c0_seq52:1618-2925(-)
MHCLSVRGCLTCRDTCIGTWCVLTSCSRSLRSMVKEVDCGAPVTAVSFMDDGVTVAIGTSDGTLKVFDLRAGFHPRKTVADAHTGDVRCVAFQQRASAPTMPAPGAGVRVAVDATAGGPDTTARAAEPLHGATAEVGDVRTTGAGRQPLARTALLNAAAVAAARGTRLHAHADHLDSSAGAGTVAPDRPQTPTSPLDGGINGGMSCYTRSAPAAHQIPIGLRMCVSCVVGIGGVQVSVPYEPLCPSNVHHTDQLGPSSLSPDDVPSATSTPVRHPASPPAATRSAGLRTSLSPPRMGGTTAASPATHARPLHAKAPASHVAGGSATAAPATAPPLHHTDNDDEKARGVGQASTASPTQLTADAADTVRVVVDECLASFRRDVHRDIHNMHIDLIRQFQIQKNEMEHLLSSLSLNEDLVAEIARLREENQQLRQRF